MNISMLVSEARRLSNVGDGRVSASRSNKVSIQVKRVLDIVVAGSVLVIFSPLFAAIALAVRLCMGPPVLFRQLRLGFRGTPFIMLKFRTMADLRGADGNVLPDGDRITRLGKFLRNTSLDELPELLSVLKGDMSLVGPRPLLLEYVALYTKEQWGRHDMKPGMAGLVIAAGRNNLTWEDKFYLDLWYVKNWSLALDLQVLWATFLNVLRRNGVSAPACATAPRWVGTASDHDRS